LTDPIGGSAPDPKRPVQSPAARLVHDLANPLSAVLAEAQLLLLDADTLAPEVVTSLRAIETAALRMRALLREVSSPRE
jgi:signal transduction histidine kinase